MTIIGNVNVILLWASGISIGAQKATRLVRLITLKMASLISASSSQGVCIVDHCSYDVIVCSC